MSFLQLADFNGSTKRNRYQEAMFKSMGSRDQFLLQLEEERKCRSEDKRRAEGAVTIQKHWRRHSAREVLRDKARAAFDICGQAENAEQLSYQATRLSLCYQHPQDDERLLMICGNTLALVRAAKQSNEFEQKSPFSRATRIQIVTTVLKFLARTGRETNVAAPLRTLSELVDLDIITTILISHGFFPSMLHLISLFAPSTSTIHLEQRLPPKLESLCDQLVMPVLKADSERAVVLGALMSALCTAESLSTSISIVLPYLQRLLISGKLLIQDFIISSQYVFEEYDMKTDADWTMPTYCLVSFFRDFSLENTSATLVDKLFSLVAAYAECLPSVQKVKDKEKEAMETDQMSNEQVLTFALKSIGEILTSPQWVSQCLQTSSHEAILAVAQVAYRSNQSSIHDGLAFNRAFVQRLWQVIESVGIVTTFGQRETFIGMLKNGFRLSANGQSALLPALSLFATLLSMNVRNVEDEEFNDANTKIPFTHEQLTHVASELRDVTLGLIDLAFPGDMQPKTKDPEEAARWSAIYDDMVLLMRTLQQKDQRVQFLPEGLWSAHSRQVVLQHSSFLNRIPVTRRVGRHHRSENEPGSSDSDESDGEGGGAKIVLSSTELRNLSIMRSIPFVVPFKERTKMFDEMLRQDREVHGADDWGFQRDRSINISVRRQHIYEDAFEALTLTEVPNLRFPMRVNMINWVGLQEAGIDGGGIFREFLSELVRTAFDPDKGFFQYTADRLLYPNPLAAKLYDNYSQHFYFLGRIIAKLIYEKQLAEIRFADFFLAQLLGADRARNVDLHHMKSYDPALFRQLVKLRDLSEKELKELDLDFTVMVEELGEARTVELVRGGAEIPVTTQNRREYVQLFCNYFLYKRMEPIVDSMRAGVTNVLDVQLLAIFSPAELQLLVSGADVDVDIDDLRRHCIVHPSHQEGDEAYMDTFWETLKEMGPEEKRAFLKFVTGCSRPPLDGFKGLNPKMGIQLVHLAEQTPLPTSATCMNLLKLPVYGNRQVLAEKLRYAIHAGAGFELS